MIAALAWIYDGTALARAARQQREREMLNARAVAWWRSVQFWW